MAIDVKTQVVQCEGVLSTALDDDLVLMHLARDSYYGMNPVSRRIWELLAEPKSLAAVCDILLVEFEVEPAECEQDVLDFTQALLDAGLVKTLDT